MKRRGRRQHVAKWFLTSFVFLSTRWIALGAIWSAEYVHDCGLNVLLVRLGAGTISFNAEDKAAARRDFAFVFPPDGLHRRRVGSWPGLSLVPWSGWFSSRDAFSVRVSVLPFLLIAILPTLLLWLRYISARDGECELCRYNLTGNTSGICPECGGAVPVSTEGQANRV